MKKVAIIGGGSWGTALALVIGPEIPSCEALGL